MEQQQIRTFPVEGRFQWYNKAPRIKNARLVSITVATDSPPTVFAYKDKKLTPLNAQTLGELLTEERLDLKDSDRKWLQDLIVDVMERQMLSSRLAIINNQADFIRAVSDSRKEASTFLSKGELEELLANCQGKIAPSSLDRSNTGTQRLKFCVLHSFSPMPSGALREEFTEYQLKISPEFVATLATKKIYSKEIQKKPGTE